jgi:hypothetical protein
MIQPQFNSAILPAYARLLHRDSSVNPSDNFYNPTPLKKAAWPTGRICAIPPEVRILLRNI